ncbi:alpha/beta hydrolase [Streptomyces sp. NPDC006872]|uniref:alpha/beta fold hydrolase n=1 Tax=Streptomyces sp. NPDC006872 TaxID=3155720 RepID=UPI0033C2B4E8
MESPAEAFSGRTWKYWTQPTVVDVQGVPTAYRRAGEGETLVYLHGGGNTRSWLPFHQELAKHFDVVAPEHPGFGDTPRGPEMDRWEDWVLHYDAFFSQLGLTDFHLVGNSLGGWLAANLAVYYPQRFKSLTLVTPTGLRLLGAPLIDVFRWTPEEAASALFNGRAERYLDQLVQQGEPEDGIQAYQEESTGALLMWNPRYDLKLDTRLSRIAAPTLCVGVDDDRVVGTGMSARYADLIPGAKHLRISGPSGEPSGHMVFMEQPGDTVAAITEHVNRNARLEA